MKPERKKALADLREERDRYRDLWHEESKRHQESRAHMARIFRTADIDFDHIGDELATNRVVALLKNEPYGPDWFSTQPKDTHEAQADVQDP